MPRDSEKIRDEHTESTDVRAFGKFRSSGLALNFIFSAKLQKLRDSRAVVHGFQTFSRSTKLLFHETYSFSEFSQIYNYRATYSVSGIINFGSQRRRQFSPNGRVLIISLVVEMSAYRASKRCNRFPRCLRRMPFSQGTCSHSWHGDKETKS